MGTKKCALCARDKPLDEYHTRRDGHGGHYPQPHCKPCKGVFNSMRTVVDGVLVAPKIADVRAAILGGATAPATLRTITHKRPKRRPRPAQPQHIAEKRQEVRTWDREAAAALPVTNHVYLMAIQGCRDAVKIGESWDAHYRAADGQTWHWRPVVVLGFVPTDIAKDADKPVHAKFAQHHIANEWFRPAAEVLSYFGVSNAAFFRKTATPRK